MSKRNGKVCGICCWYEAEHCHVMPPTPTHDFPSVREDDWCSKWEPEAPNVRREREAASPLTTIEDLA